MPECHKCPLNGKHDPRCMTCPGFSDREIGREASHRQHIVSLESLAEHSGGDISRNHAVMDAVPLGECRGESGSALSEEAEDAVREVLRIVASLEDSLVLVLLDLMRGLRMRDSCKRRGMSVRTIYLRLQRLRERNSALAAVFGSRKQ